MTANKTGKTIKEAARETSVCYEADVVVVGGGPGGHSAAMAAARNGAKTVLLERYGHLGGMASGGIVIQIPHMSDGGPEQQIAGLVNEWIDRLEPLGGVLVPNRKDIGSDDPQLVNKWKRFMGNVRDGRIAYTAWVDTEMTKCILNDMVEEAGIKLYLHSWGVQSIVEENRVKGVIFESKSGRQAILGKVVIDGTGDGDLLPSAGADFDATLDLKARSSMLALVFRLGNCDYQKLCDFREAQPEKWAELFKQLTEEAGTRLAPFPTPYNDVMWVNNWIPDLNCMNVEDLTTLEVEMRKIMRKGHAFIKKNIPTFENSFILDTAPQTGTRGARRLTAEHVLTSDELRGGKMFEDTIAVYPRMGPPGATGNSYVYIPYRCLVPIKVEGLLVAGRSFGSDAEANNMANLIPHCIANGQASGAAAGLAVKQGIDVREVNIPELQANLVKQGVKLPGIKTAAAA